MDFVDLSFLPRPRDEYLLSSSLTDETSEGFRQDRFLHTRKRNLIPIRSFSSYGHSPL